MVLAQARGKVGLYAAEGVTKSKLQRVLLLPSKDTARPASRGGPARPSSLFLRPPQMSAHFELGFGVIHDYFG